MIRLPDPLRERLLAAAAAAYPEEACGLLVGRAMADGTLLVTAVAESANVAEGDRRRQFEVDPKVRFEVMREVERSDTDERLIGHYHSHPDHPPRPSATDLSMAYEPDLVWVIVGAASRQAGPVRAFRLAGAGDRFDEIEVTGSAAGGEPAP